jgi:tRNA(fMet)-specific endonuclease VapC
MIDCNVATALKYGDMKTALKAKGRPIPENDIWIAATALQHGLTLVSRDAHFNEVEEITVEEWR